MKMDSADAAMIRNGDRHRQPVLLPYGTWPIDLRRGLAATIVPISGIGRSHPVLAQNDPLGVIMHFTGIDVARDSARGTFIGHELLNLRIST